MSAAPDAVAALLERAAFLVSLDETTFFDVEPGSPLDTDDTALEPLSPSATVAATLRSAFAHLDALDTLLDAHAPPTTAAFACVRGALDASAVAIWLLEPQGATERYTRFLSDAWGDIRDADRLVTALAGDPEATARAERAWAAARERALPGAEPAAAQLPVSPARRLEVAAGVVADFTRVPNAAAIIRGGWQGLAGIARGRLPAYGLDAEGAAGDMLAGTLSMALDVAETAASLFHVRAVADDTGAAPADAAEPGA
jgi:hypothetical protein